MSKSQPEPTAESAELEVIVHELTELLDAINHAEANPMSQFANDRAAITANRLQALLDTAKAEAYKAGLEQNGAYFHQREQAKAEGVLEGIDLARDQVDWSSEAFEQLTELIERTKGDTPDE